MSRAGEMIWTEDKVSDVLKRWAQGETSRTIAATYGVSRNAIIGVTKRRGGVRKAQTLQYGWSAAEKAQLTLLVESGAKYPDIAIEMGRPLASVTGCGRRLGLKSKYVTRAVKKPAKPAARKHSATPQAPLCVDTMPTHASRGVAFLDLRKRDCRYPLSGWNERAVLFCGNPTIEGESYCRDCRVIVYRPVAA